jgi:AraC-like DNA-binding protein
MIFEEHFSLRLTRIKPADQWNYKGEGVAILIFKKGVGTFIADHATFKTAAGDVLILTQGAKGRLLVSDAKEVVFFNFSLCLEHLFPLFAGHEIALLEDVFDGLKNSKLLAAATPLALEVNRLIEDVLPEYNVVHRSQLLSIAAAILNEEFKTAQQGRAGFVQTEDRVVKVFEKLSTDELLNLSISELAAKFGCSRRHLSRLSHRYFGRSIAELKMEMRLMKAVACLRNPQAKIINVAEQCGFNHLGLFNTCFKRRFGASPGKWRNMAAGKPSISAGVNNHMMPNSEPGSARILLNIANENRKQTHSFPMTASILPEGGKRSFRRNSSQLADVKSFSKKFAVGTNYPKNRKAGHKLNGSQTRVAGRKP